MRQLRIQAGVLALGLACGLGGVAAAQEPGEQASPSRGQFAGMQRVGGEVTAVSGDTVSVKTEDGGSAKITTTANTRLMKGQGVPFKMADLKVGDGVLAMGNMDAATKTLHAAMMFATDAEQVKKLKENMGKTYISGKVTAIDADNLKMTVLRPDGVSQTIGFDESTSFKRVGRGMRGGNSMAMLGGTVQAPAQGNGTPVGAGNGAAQSGGESITLADIKVGDLLAGQGSLKGGTFVPTQLTVGGGEWARGRRPGRTGVPDGATSAAPDASAPKPQ